VSHSPACPSRPTPHRGISLLEVLISMGILTVGLLSVLSLVPAGKSQAVKAVIYDRSSVMASNVAADLISRGLLRTSAWATGKVAAPIAVFDPLYSATNAIVAATGTTVYWPPLASAVSTAIAVLPDAATTGTASTFTISGTTFSGVIRGSGTAGRFQAVQEACDILFRSEDDPLYTLDGVGPDDPPLPRWSGSVPGAPAAGRRAFEGLYSFLATVQTSATAAPFWDAATPATLTVVTFQRRDPTVAPLVLVPDVANDLWRYSTAALPSGQTIRDVIRPGVLVLWLNNTASPTAARWFRVVLAAEQQPGNVALTCEGADPDPTLANAAVYVFPGAVGGIEVPVKLEGTSVWNR
jgi:Tfp pilus assembly protein PilV